MIRRGIAIWCLGFLVSFSASVLPLVQSAHAQEATSASGSGKKLSDIQKFIGEIHDVSLDGITIRVPELRNTELDDSPEWSDTGLEVVLRLKRSLPFGVMTYLYAFSKAPATVSSIHALADSPQFDEMIRERFPLPGNPGNEEYREQGATVTEAKIVFRDEESVVISYSGTTRSNGEELNLLLLECYMPIRNRVCRIALTGISRDEIKTQNLLVSLLLWRRVIAIANEEED